MNTEESRAKTLLDSIHYTHQCLGRLRDAKIDAMCAKGPLMRSFMPEDVWNSDMLHEVELSISMCIRQLQNTLVNLNSSYERAITPQQR